MTVNDNQPLKCVRSKSSKQCDQGYGRGSYQYHTK